MQLLRSSQCTCNASQVQSKTSRRPRRAGAGKNWLHTKNCKTYSTSSERLKQHLHRTQIQEGRKQSIPSDCISRNNFPIAQSFVPAEHVQFIVPSLLWASTGRICWKCDTHATPHISVVEPGNIINARVNYRSGQVWSSLHANGERIFVQKRKNESRHIGCYLPTTNITEIYI